MDLKDAVSKPSTLSHSMEGQLNYLYQKVGLPTLSFPAQSLSLAKMLICLFSTHTDKKSCSPEGNIMKSAHLL